MLKWAKEAYTYTRSGKKINDVLLSFRVKKVFQSSIVLIDLPRVLVRESISFVNARKKSQG